MGKVVIFSAPSGSGKSTIVGKLLEQFGELEFSVSATSRAPRGAERDGVEYFFFTNDEFARRVAEGDFLEWEEVYAGTCYGTLKSEIERIWTSGKVVIFDVDVVGGQSIKRIFGNDALAIFVMPPSVDELRRRLVTRATDSLEAIERRVAKAASEMEFAEKFDVVIVNDNLETAVAETEKVVADFIRKTL